MDKKIKCKHKNTHTEHVSGTHHQYEAVVCNKCDKVVKFKVTK